MGTGLVIIIKSSAAPREGGATLQKKWNTNTMTGAEQRLATGDEQKAIASPEPSQSHPADRTKPFATRLMLSRKASALVNGKK